MENNEGPYGLAHLLKKPILRNVWYNEKLVYLDGYHFEYCRFDNCQLFINTTNFELQRCFIDENTTISYGEAPMNAIKLFNRPYEWIYENAPDFAPTRHADGTISISSQR